MSKPNHEFLRAARLRLGSPFWNHYDPEDNCSGGRFTVPYCMEHGLKKEYDCSGIVIASLCDVLGISTKDWPPEYRHANQISGLEEKRAAPYSGDVVVFHPTGHTYGLHVGIFVARHTIIQAGRKADTIVVHASGINGVVTEGAIKGSYSSNGVVTVEKLLEIGSLAKSIATQEKPTDTK